MERVAVIGAGSWGTTVAALAAQLQPTVLWARRSDLATAINREGENRDYLPGAKLPAELRATADLEEALAAEAIVWGVPSHGCREVLGQARAFIRPEQPILSLTKGIEQGTLLRMTQVMGEMLPQHPTNSIGVLTGPNLAAEVMAGQPAATVIAMEDEDTAKALQGLLMQPSFRVYTNRDLIGCESAGALKNVMAIAAGMSVGLGFGDNSLAALITRALAELSRLGVAMGGKPATFAGLAGVGDLVATCMSEKSRNHQVGVQLAAGRKLDEITKAMNMVAEGVKSTRAVLDLAIKHETEMPIATQVGRVLYEGDHPRQAVLALMTRQARAED